VPIKIYATDIDKAALEFASNGVYDENIVASVTSDRIARFFVKKGSNYHVVRR
jgi:two-component system CheB/CheR fusion protein